MHDIVLRADIESAPTKKIRDAEDVVPYEKCMMPDRKIAGAREVVTYDGYDWQKIKKSV